MDDFKPVINRPVYLNDRSLGAFAVPPATDDQEPDAPLRLIVPPVWDETGSVLMLLEIAGDGGHPIAWHTQTPGEREEAQRLYAATHTRWESYDALMKQPREPGQWVIRLWTLGQSEYVKTSDPKWLFGDNEDLPGILTSNPNQAAIMTHDQAIGLIRPLMEDWDQYEDSDAVYFEPMRLNDAVAEHERHK